MTTVEQRNFARKIECEEEGMYFARYFFKQRTGGKMIIAPHHWRYSGHWTGLSAAK